MRKFITIWILLMLSLSSFSQKVSKTAEKTIASIDQRYSLIPVDSLGVVLFYQSPSLKSKVENWTIERYDMTLNRTLMSSFSVSGKYSFVQHDYSNGSLNVLFEHRGGKKFRVCRVNIDDGSVERNDLEAFTKIRVINMKVTEKGLFMKGTLYGNQALLHGNFNTGKIRTLVTAFKGSPKIEHINVESDQTVNAVIINYKNSNEHLTIRKYSSEGKQLSQYSISRNEKNDILNARLFHASETDDFVLGSFESHTYEEGIFVSQFNNKQKVYEKYVAFEDLNFSSNNDSLTNLNFWKGKQYRFFADKILKQKDGYFLIGEIYRPVYRTETQTFFDAAGLPVTRYYKIFDGWKYTHALMSKISFSGEISWSHAFELDPVIMNQTRSILNFYETDDQLMVMFTKDGKFVYYAVNKTKTSEQLNSIVYVEPVQDETNQFKAGENMSKINNGRFFFWNSPDPSAIRNGLRFKLFEMSF